MKSRRCNLAILGGGLAGSLIALALASRRPDLDIVLIEQDDRLGGNHIWSFFGPDIAAADRWLITPLICQGWRGYDVRFPAHSRTLSTTYYSILSDRLDAHVRKSLPAASILTGVRAIAASQTNVVLNNGTRIEADGVIDARGGGSLSHLNCGWQKFMGQMLDLAEPHGLDRPIVMDATVGQIDGYRFVYCLPFGPRQVFVEDTYYSEDRRIDVPQLEGRIAEYAERQGWQVTAMGRRETGALPVVWGGDFARYWQSTGGDVAKAGVRAGLFHGLTGYSLPSAVRMAIAMTRMKSLRGDALAKFSRQQGLDHWHDDAFYRMLSNMLFNAADPKERYKVLERFYRLPQSLISRFYAGRSTLADKGRVLIGKPPVPIGKAIGALAGSGRKVDA
ncbi:MAG: lycopene beta-cyclase CrtY [Blastomonas sp.]